MSFNTMTASVSNFFQLASNSTSNQFRVSPQERADGLGDALVQTAIEISLQRRLQAGVITLVSPSHAAEESGALSTMDAEMFEEEYGEEVASYYDRVRSIVSHPSIYAVTLDIVNQQLIREQAEEAAAAQRAEEAENWERQQEIVDNYYERVRSVVLILYPTISRVTVDMVKESLAIAQIEVHAIRRLFGGGYEVSVANSPSLDRVLRRGGLQLNRNWFLRVNNLAKRQSYRQYHGRARCYICNSDKHVKLMCFRQTPTSTCSYGG